MNQIEIWFSILARKLLHTASFKSLEDLRDRIMAFIEYFNTTMAKPFKWMFRGFNQTNALGDLRQMRFKCSGVEIGRIFMS